MIRVFVIATTPMQQIGLRAMLTTSEIEVVGESLVPDTALDTLPENDVIVIADEVLLEDAVSTLPDDETVAIVVMANNERIAFSLLRSSKVRSWGIIPSTASASYLQGTIVAVAQGSVVFPSTLMRGSHEAHLYVQSVPLETQGEVLTAREHEVLELVSQGLSNKLIARHLQISEHTVKFHVSSVSTKLGAASRTDAVRLGLRKGLITL